MPWPARLIENGQRSVIWKADAADYRFLFIVQHNKSVTAKTEYGFLAQVRYPRRNFKCCNVVREVKLEQSYIYD